MNRYEVQESEEGHYKLDYIVIDKTKPKYHIDDANKELEPICYDITCHCKDESMANLICEALNKWKHTNQASYQQKSAVKY